MQKKLILVITVLVILSGLFISFEDADRGSERNILNNVDPACSYMDQTQFEKLLEQENANVHLVIQREQYYEITKHGSLYYCCFYGENGKQIKTEGPLTKIPEVAFVDPTLIRFTYQAGTGIGTQWGFYYDTNCKKFSEVFQSIVDQQSGKVAYFLTDKIVVQDIFNKDKYYKEFTEFGCPISKVAEPFINAQIMDGNAYIEITYLSGDDYREITETFPL